MEEAPNMSNNEEKEVPSRVENPVRDDQNILKDSEGEIAAAVERADSLSLESDEQEEARLAGIEDDSLDKAA